MSGQPARESAYADLVAGLLDARDDVATARFDAELTAAVADGRLDATTARTLRWWQRAAVRSVVDHARTALPPVLAALDRAHDLALDEVAEAARSLDDALATALPGPAGAPEPSPGPEPSTTSQPPATPEGSAALPPVPGPAVAAPEAESTVDLREVDPASRRLLVAGLTPLPPT